MIWRLQDLEVTDLEVEPVMVMVLPEIDGHHGHVLGGGAGDPQHEQRGVDLGVAC